MLKVVLVFVRRSSPKTRTSNENIYIVKQNKLMPVTPSGQMFPREVRLLNAKQYSYVFADARRFGNQSFTLLVRLNDQSHPRLGLAIAKKSVKRAVDRNRIKRLLRESFRHKQHQLPPIDIIAMCRPVVVQLNNEQILRQLEKQWCYMQKKLTYQHAR